MTKDTGADGLWRREHRSDTSGEQPDAHFPVSDESHYDDALFRSHFERCPSAVALVDAPSHVVCYANPALLELAGASRHSLEAPRLPDIFVGNSSDAVTALINEVRRTGESTLGVEFERRSPSKESRYWHVSAWPLHAADEFRSKVIVEVRDVTDDVMQRDENTSLSDQIRQMNSRLVLAAMREQELSVKAEAASEAKSTFLATMSHELRTPLTAVIGYQELLAEGITGPVTSEQRVQLARIRSSAVHLLSLIDQILTFSRIESGDEVFTHESVAIGALTKDVVAMCAPLASGKGLSLTVRTPDEDIVVDTDSLKVRQILTNLLGNAIRFTNTGGVRVEVRADSGEARLTIADTGIGIPREHLDSVFEPFWQVEQRSTRKIGGTGLGLSVSRRLARFVGGDIVLESEVGRGSRITLSLPMLSSVSTGANAAAGAA